MAEKIMELIKEQDNIYDILTKYPHLKEVLVSMSPKYKRLYNPVIFNTVAKITTLKKAAEVGNIYINELLYKLNEAIGKGQEYLEYFERKIPEMQEDFLKKQFETGGADLKEKPVWMTKSDKFSILDATKIDGEPFNYIIESANRLKKGEGLVLIQKFVPAPMISYLGKLGSESFVERENEDIVKVYFYRKGDDKDDG